MNLACERGQVFDLLLTRYALERLLYRLSISECRNRFAIKGAMLDIGFGDAVEPGLEDIDLPVLLDLPARHLCAYARGIARHPNRT